MNKYKAVLFDFDGTLMDTNDIILNSWRHTFKTLLGRPCEDSEVVGTFGEVLIDTMKQIFPDRDSDECVKIYRSYQVEHYDKDIKLCEGMKELVIELKNRGYLISVVTSRLKDSTKVGLEKFGIADKFDAFVSCDDTDAHKPDPTPCLIALKKLKVKPEEAIFIGDSKYDIQCAHNAGVKAILVDWTICLPKEDRVGANAPDFTVEKAEEILDIV